MKLYIKFDWKQMDSHQTEIEKENIVWIRAEI